MTLSLQQILWVALGGSLGASARFLVSAWCNARFDGAFPWGTFTVNFLGSLLFGVLFILVFAEHAHREVLRLFLLVGFFGAFTTFSTFSFETVRLLESGMLMMAFTNMAANLLCCVLGAWLGMGLARLV